MNDDFEKSRELVGVAISSHFALLPQAMEQRTGRVVGDCY
jgi:hypothetical protein